MYPLSPQRLRHLLRRKEGPCHQPHLRGPLLGTGSQGIRSPAHLPTCPDLPHPHHPRGAGGWGTEAGLEAGGSWGVHCPLPRQTCCFCPALITQVLENPPRPGHAHPAPSTSPRRSVSLSHGPHRTPSPRRQRGLPGAAPGLGEGLPTPLTGEQPGWHHFWRRLGWGPSPKTRRGSWAEVHAQVGMLRGRHWVDSPQAARGSGAGFVHRPGRLAGQRPLWRVLSQSPFALEAVPTAAPWRTCGQDHSFSTGPWTGCLP